MGNKIRRKNNLHKSQIRLKIRNGKTGYERKKNQLFWIGSVTQCKKEEGMKKKSYLKLDTQRNSALPKSIEYRKIIPEDPSLPFRNYLGCEERNASLGYFSRITTKKLDYMCSSNPSSPIEYI